MEQDDVCRRMGDVENEQDEDVIIGLEEGLEGWGPIHKTIDETTRIPLFEGSTLSSLYATLVILNCCHTHGASNAFITKLLGLLKKNILPTPNTLPSSEYEASSTLKRLGPTYDVIDVCPKGCMLFWGEHVNAKQCIKCEEPRYM
jgi:hypothetical protein